MSIALLAEAQTEAFKTIVDVLADPTAYDLDTQRFRADLAFTVVNMVPAGAFDFLQQENQLEEAPERVEGEVIDFPTQEEIEQRAALEQVTVVHTPGPDPHGAPPLGGVG